MSALDLRSVPESNHTQPRHTATALAAALGLAESRLKSHLITLATLLLQYNVDVPNEAALKIAVRRERLTHLREAENELKQAIGSTLCAVTAMRASRDTCLVPETDALNAVASTLQQRLSALRECIAPLAEESDGDYLAAHRIVVAALSLRTHAQVLALIESLPPENSRFAENYAALMHQVESLCLQHAACLEQQAPAPAMQDASAEPDEPALADSTVAVAA